MTKVAIIGVGFMGWIHYLAYGRAKGVELTAICTRDPKKAAGDWTGIQGNFGPPGQHVDLTGLAVHRELSTVLEDSDIEAVDICLPPRMHADVATAALAAGKHVLCEKPIALRTAEARRMLEAAKQSRKVLAVAHVLPYMGAYAAAVAMIRGGRLGQMRSLVLKRIIGEPSWIPDFYDPESVGGPLIDLTIHDLHFVRSLLGRPSEVTAAGWTRGNVPAFASSLWRFDDRAVSAIVTSGVGTTNVRGFSQGFEIHGDGGLLTYDLHAADKVASLPLTFYPVEGAAEIVSLPATDEIDAFAAELTDFGRLIAGECAADSSAAMLDGTLALDALKMAEATAAAVVSRRSESIDWGTA